MTARTGPEYVKGAHGKIVDAKPIAQEAARLNGGGPPEPDPLWNELGRIVDVARTRGLALDLDPVAVGRALEILASIDARRYDPIAFIDRARLGAPLPVVKYPVRGFALSPGAVALFLAFAFGGKTIILQDLLLAIAFGQRAWGWFTCEPARVVHLDYEQGEHQTIDRYQRLARARGIPMEDLASAPIDLAPYPRAHLFTPGAEEAYKRAFDGAAVALIDTFGAASPGRDENETQIAEALYMLGRVSEQTGCAVIVAHHMGKASMGEKGGKADPRTLARGSTAIVAAAGYVYAMGGSRDEPKLVQQAKGRGLGDPRMEDFYLELAAVDVRQPDPETGYPGFYNPSNALDIGGFRVSYRTVEQVKPPKPPAQDDLDEDLEAVRSYIRAQNAKGLGVASGSACAKPCKLRKGDALNAVKELLARKEIEHRGPRGERTLWLANRLKGV